MITLGRSYELEVCKQVDFGFYLDAGDLGEVLLPRRAAPKDLEVGAVIEAFLYLDSEDRPVATTKKPLIEIGQFAYLKVVERTKFGAFLDWGLDKHLLLPFGEQHRPVEEGKKYLVFAYLDDRDGRIVASSKVDQFVEDDSGRAFKPLDQVDLIIANSTDLGFKAIVNNRYWGVLYRDEVFQRLSFGQSIQGFIQRVRPDGRIDLTLNGGYKSQDKNCDILVAYLNKLGGSSPLNDKSDPQQIKDALSMSKGAFKKAAGRLLKQNKLAIGKDGIRLID